MARISRYKLKDSDRSGFTCHEIDMVKDSGVLVSPDEFDEPPPSKISLGGEGETSPGFIRSETSLTIDSWRENPTVYITAAGGISYSLVHPYMRISGSNNAVNISANPQITRGKQGDILSIMCVGSNVTLENGTGLNLMNSSAFVMQSGAVITLIYTSGDLAWQETSRSTYGFGG